MRRIRFVVIAVTLAAQAPFALALAWIGSHFVAAWIAWSVGVALALLSAELLRGRVKKMFHDRPVSSARRLFEQSYYAHWGATILALPVSLLVVPAFVLAGASMGRGAAWAYGGSLLVALYSVFVRPVWTRVRELEVPIAGLGASFDGYRIAHLSDLHVGSLCPVTRADRWVRITNALKVDAVALTGDYVTSGTVFHEMTARALSKLSATDGVFAVLGNHDDYGGGEPLRSAMLSGGIHLLQNERAEIVRGEQKLTIAGVDDTFTRHADVERTFAGIDPRASVVALAHDPALFPELAKRGVGLQLSGHTHWGQIALPFFPERINLAVRFYELHAGMVRDGASTLYIHPGLGMTGPPIRLGAPPEITVLRLRALTE